MQTPTDDCCLITERSRRAFYKEFVKVVEAADVILEVLDARDPLAYRATEVEAFIRSADPNKKIVLLLNKIGVPSSLRLAISSSYVF